MNLNPIVGSYEVPAVIWGKKISKGLQWSYIYIYIYSTFNKFTDFFLYRHLKLS